MELRFIEIKFHPNVETLRDKLGLGQDSDEAEDFVGLLEKALPYARPKAALGTAVIDSIDESGKVVIEGVEFHSPLLAKNLEGIRNAWPYLATCGRELYEFTQSIPDPFERFWLDAVMQQALTEVRAAMTQLLADELYEGKTAAMGPGSLEEWPISQQKPLFRLLGEAPEKCGVTLTDTMLMLPNKSVSGIFFPNEHGYVNCRLCPRENCPNRKAPYDQEFDPMNM